MISSRNLLFPLGLRFMLEVYDFLFKPMIHLEIYDFALEKVTSMNAVLTLGSKSYFKGINQSLYEHGPLRLEHS